MLAPFKCPRWFAFLDDLAKTAGKIQRFKLRETAALDHTICSSLIGWH